MAYFGRSMESQSMPCPSCGAELEPASGQHGIVWLCRACRAGAATLPILRKVAPRAFVNQLWQAALADAVPSPRICPSCTQPFAGFAGSRAKVEPNLEVCTRCYWVWLDSATLKLVSRVARPRLKAGKTPRDALLQLAAGVVLDGFS
jgi:Zn-finger nucleic acid-binding protein